MAASSLLLPSLPFFTCGETVPLRGSRRHRPQAVLVACGLEPPLPTAVPSVNSIKKTEVGG